MGHDLTRSEVARLLSIGPSTLARWENSQATPQTAIIWKILRELENAAADVGSKPYINELKIIIEDYARQSGLQADDAQQAQLRLVERSLSQSVLKAATTDFRLNLQTNQVEPTVFASDLELFKHQNNQDLHDLLQSLSRQAQELADDISSVNANTQLLKRALLNYCSEAVKNRPNPRWLLAKGDQIKATSREADFLNAANTGIASSLEIFIQQHDDLMRMYFGQAVIDARSVDINSISGVDVDRAKEILAEASDLFERLISRPPTEDEIGLAPSTKVIFDDLRTDADQLQDALRRTNDPGTERTIAIRLLHSVLHGALYVGRLVFRILGVTIERGSQVGAIGAAVELATPGSLSALYMRLAEVFSNLPSLPL